MADPNFVAIFYTGASMEFHEESVEKARERMQADYPAVPYILLRHIDTIFSWRFIYLVATEFNIDLKDENMERICRLATKVRSVINDLERQHKAV